MDAAPRKTAFPRKAGAVPGARFCRWRTTGSPQGLSHIASLPAYPGVPEGLQHDREVSVGGSRFDTLIAQRVLDMATRLP